MASQDLPCLNSGVKAPVVPNGGEHVTTPHVRTEANRSNMAADGHVVCPTRKSRLCSIGDPRWSSSKIAFVYRIAVRAPSSIVAIAPAIVR
jgi:hypothetical protein